MSVHNYFVILCHIELTSSTTATNVVDKIFPLECELPQSIKFSTGLNIHTCYTICVILFCVY